MIVILEMFGQVVTVESWPGGDFVVLFEPGNSRNHSFNGPLARERFVDHMLYHKVPLSVIRMVKGLP